MINNYKGVSLVALVITIIVLLILAGISLSFAFGENGIITKAQEAKERTNISQAEETIKTRIANLQVEKNGQATIEDIMEIESDDIKIIPNTGTTVDIAYNEKYIFTVDNKFNISYAREFSEDALSKIEPALVFDNFQRDE